jgi:hypothetical protein
MVPAIQPSSGKQLNSISHIVLVAGTGFPKGRGIAIVLDSVLDTGLYPVL